jgi:hypothetical protein
MTSSEGVADVIRTLLRDDVRVGIVLSEILGPPLGLRGLPSPTE